MNKKNFLNNKLYSLDEIMSTGTLFKDLYKPYKKTPKIIPESKEENDLLKIQLYEIALMDLNLYLDVYPNDNSLTNLFKQYQSELDKLVIEFENKYYPIKTKNAVQNENWKWNDGKWPWECEK